MLAIVLVPVAIFALFLVVVYTISSARNLPNTKVELPPP